MPKYIDADEFVKLKRKWYCEACEKRKGMKRGKLQFVYEIGGAPCRACDVDDVISDIEDFPAADVEPKQKWIPVTDTENLPKRSMPCLVACNQWGGEIVRKATWLASERIFHENGRDITEYVTHWMESPKPPKEGDHENQT